MIGETDLAQVGAGASTARGGTAFEVSITSLIVVLGLAVVAVVIASFMGHLGLARAGLAEPAFGTPAMDQVSRVTKLLLKFDVTAEQTVAAWLSSALMLLCAAVALFIGTVQRRVGGAYAWHWLGLGVIFIGLSADETVSFHEMTIKPVHEALGTSGIFLYAWVIPGLIFVTLVGLAYLGFVFHFEARYRNGLIAAGTVFVAGALGFEMIEGAFADSFTRHAFVLTCFQHVEDLLEFTGLLIFLYTLLRYIQQHVRHLTVTLR